MLCDTKSGRRGGGAGAGLKCAAGENRRQVAVSGRKERRGKCTRLIGDCTSNFVAERVEAIKSERARERESCKTEGV